MHVAWEMETHDLTTSIPFLAQLETSKVDKNQLTYISSCKLPGVRVVDPSSCFQHKEQLADCTSDHKILNKLSNIAKYQNTSQFQI